MSGAAARTGSYKKIGERKDIEVASWEVPQKLEIGQRNKTT